MSRKRMYMVDGIEVEAGSVSDAAELAQEQTDSYLLSFEEEGFEFEGEEESCHFN